jgi:hypothetical protein
MFATAVREQLGKRPTRKQLVLIYLQTRANHWVPGMELMNQYVGGTRASARIHELRREGHTIERRTSNRSAVDEYRYVDTRQLGLGLLSDGS